MRLGLLKLLPVGLLAVSTAALSAVDVGYPGAEDYTDAAELRETQGEFTRHLERLGSRYLAPSQSLRVEFLDIDLAGYVRPFGRRDIRVVNGRGDFPVVALRYVLEVDGKVVDRGEETITDSSRGLGMPLRLAAEPLGYEKRMLEKWFRHRFVDRRAAAR